LRIRTIVIHPFFDFVGLPSFSVEVLYSSVYVIYVSEILIFKTYFMYGCVFVFDNEVLCTFLYAFVMCEGLCSRLRIMKT